MQIIQASSKIEKHGDEYILKRIEMIGRVCYKSENLITEDSSVRFAKNLIKREHYSVLEHHRLIFKIPQVAYTTLLLAHKRPFTEHIYDGLKYFEFTNSSKGLYLISFNLRALLEAVICGEEGLYEDSVISILNKLMNEVCYYYPKCGVIYGLTQQQINTYTSTRPLGNAYSLVTLEELLSNDLYTRYDRLTHGWATNHFICDRGVSHELVRHRPCGFSQESTRYCNYSKKGLTFIDNKFLPNESARDLWLHSCKKCEDAYNKAIYLGMKPEIARGLLNNSIKTELYMTATFKEMVHFFKMRTSPKAHPQMREIAIPLAKQYLATFGSVFNGALKECINNFSGGALNECC